MSEFEYCFGHRSYPCPCYQSDKCKAHLYEVKGAFGIEISLAIGIISDVCIRDEKLPKKLSKNLMGEEGVM